MQDVQNILSDYGEINNLLPQKPTKQEDDLTINGVDINNNGVRDYIEAIIPQFIPTEKREDVDFYKKILGMIKNIQPTQEDKVIDYHKFYCQYISLPDDFKQRTSSMMFQELVTDTKDRRKRFYEQAINMNGSLWAEDCEIYQNLK